MRERKVGVSRGARLPRILRGARVYNVMVKVNADFLFFQSIKIIPLYNFKSPKNKLIICSGFIIGSHVIAKI